MVEAGIMEQDRHGTGSVANDPKFHVRHLLPAGLRAVRILPDGARLVPVRRWLCADPARSEERRVGKECGS